jgi:Ca2+-binding EF-hand superfamily protein
MKIFSLMIPTLSLALLAGTALASPGEDERHEYYERRGPLPFEVMDLNGDGVVTRAEHAQVRTERQRVRSEQGYPIRNAAAAPAFGQIDRDGSGAIDSDELNEWHAQRVPKGMGRGW